VSFGPGPLLSLKKAAVLGQSCHLLWPSKAALDPAGVGAPGFGVLGQCRGDGGRCVTMRLHVVHERWVLVSQGRRVKGRGLVLGGILGGGGSALGPLVGSRRAGLLW